MELLTGKILSFMLVFTRVGAFFSTSPVFSWGSLPVRVKVALAAMISIFIAGAMPFTLAAEEINVVQAIVMFSGEAIYGLAFGLVARLLFSIVNIAGRIIEREMGLAMANILNPLTGENDKPLSMLIEILFIMLFLSANGHHLLLEVINNSYTFFPLASPPQIELLTGGIIRTGGVMLLLGLKLSAPILAAFLLLMVVLGVLARISPEMNILFLSLPVRVGLGFILGAIYIPFILSFINRFSALLEKMMPIPI